MTTHCKICSKLHANLLAPDTPANTCSDRFCLDVAIGKTFTAKYSGKCMICNEFCYSHLICESDKCRDALLIKFAGERTAFRYRAMLASINRLECCECRMSFQVLSHTDVNRPICLDCADNNVVQLHRDMKKRRHDIEGLSSSSFTCTSCYCVFNPREVIPLLSQMPYISKHYHKNPKCFNCSSELIIAPLAEFWNIEYSIQYDEMRDSDADVRILQRHREYATMDVDCT